MLKIIQKPNWFLIRMCFNIAGHKYNSLSDSISLVFISLPVVLFLKKKVASIFLLYFALLYRPRTCAKKYQAK